MSTQMSKAASNEWHDEHPQSGQRPALRPQPQSQPPPVPSTETAAPESSGFSGTCENTSLADWIQLVQMGRRDAVIGVRTHDGRKGLLWCRDGDVIDAWCDGVNGEDAVYRALAWEGGRISVAFATFEHPRKIEIGTAALLLRAAYRRDSGVRAIQAPSASQPSQENVAVAPPPAAAASEAGASEASAAPSASPRKRRPKRRTLVLGATALALLAVLGLGVALSPSTEKAAGEPTPPAPALHTEVAAARPQPTTQVQATAPATEGATTANTSAQATKPVEATPRVARSAPAPRRVVASTATAATAPRGNEVAGARRSPPAVKSKPELDLIDERTPQVRIIDERDSQIEVIE